MKKIHIFLLVILTIAFALILQVLFGNYLTARLTTLPLLRDISFFNPRTPVVLTNSQTVRINDATDAIETVNSVKPKISAVVYYDGTGVNRHLVRSGNAINWTSDGYLISTTSALSVPNKTYAVVLNNGDILPIKQVYADTASNLVVLAIDGKNLNTIEPVNLADLRVGEKILLLANSIGANRSSFIESYLQKQPSDVEGVSFSSDHAGRAIAIQSEGGLIAGQIAVNLKGNLVGLWDGTEVISVDVIRIFANNFFRDNKIVLRPSFGFSYNELTSAEAKGVQLMSSGAMVTSVTSGSPAIEAGLKAGDLITAINNTSISDSVLTESILATLPPQVTAKFSIIRNGQIMELNITPNLLK